MDDSVIALIERMIQEYKESLEVFLAEGGAENFDQYNRCVGKYESLSLIEREIADIHKRYIES
jgi:uncharacterized protein YqeY